MNTHTSWPDRTAFQMCGLAPAQGFADPELRNSTYQLNRSRQPLVWSGGRAMVIKANRPGGGSLAVRFLMAENHDARIRYGQLTRHLRAYPVSSMVNTEWVDDGLIVGAQRYPILKMEWVDGVGLDKFIDGLLNGATDEHRSRSGLRDLAGTWRESCRGLIAANMSHGDIHAGNTLAYSTASGTVELKLVDYDNVWVPDLTTPCREAGHPAFQHPARPANPRGQYQDAFPNTLTYLSLIALAADPGLWATHHPKTDDVLLFERADLVNPGTRTWQALLRSPDAEVRQLTGTTLEWLRGRSEAYQSLEHAISSATPLTDPGRPTTTNHWPPRPRPPAGTNGEQKWDPRGHGQPAGGATRPNPSWNAASAGPAQGAQQWRTTGPVPPNAPNQQWASTPPPPAAAAPPPPGSAQPPQNAKKGFNYTWLIVIVIILLALAWAYGKPS